ncbi:hypothetical protein Tco_1396599 [Tanacetum coccineum]
MSNDFTMGRTLLFASSSKIFGPYPRFTKIIFSHYMTIFPDILRRARDKYHNLQDDDIMKNIFNSGRHKDKVGMQIPSWMITEEMKHTEHYWMYAEVFVIDVPLTQSQPTGLPKERIGHLAPLVPNVDKADEMILQDTLQVSLAEHKSHEEQEARENIALVDEHLASEEIENMDRARSNKESPEVEITKDKEVEITKEKEVEIIKETPVVDITNVVIPVNVNDEDEEITDEVYKLKRREKGKLVEETRNSPIPTPIRSPRIISLFKTKPTRFKRYKSFFHELQGRYGYLFAHLQARFMPRKSFDTLADNLHDVM